MRIRVRGAAIAAALIVTATLTSTVTSVAPSASAAEPELIPVASLLNELAVVTPAGVAYDRDLFIEGIDEDGDGCRTRQEVLIEESNIAPVVGPNCTVSGRWVSTYDGVETTEATALEMDHLVALKEAWVSGAWAWTPQQRAAFANDLGDHRTLNMAISATNQSKSDKDPARWLPTAAGPACSYVADWVAVKWRWNLAIDQAEKDAIRARLDVCGAGAEPQMADVGVPAIGRPATPVAYVAPVEEPATAAPVPVYRFYSPIYKGHHFTTSTTERDTIISRWPGTWSYEGQVYSAYETQQPGTVPLYRFWSAKLKGHFFTADLAERDHVIRTWPSTWSYEGVAYYVYPTEYAGAVETATVARFWNAKAKHHFYTASAGERDYVKTRWVGTWAFEMDNFRVPNQGIPVFVAPKPPEPKPPVTPTKPANPGDTKNCSDFATYAQAKAWFDKYYPHYGDIAKLDADNNRIPCESLPGAPR